MKEKRGPEKDGKGEWERKRRGNRRTEATAGERQQNETEK